MLLAKAGTLLAKTSTGNQAYTGWGFQPKATIFFVTPQTALGYRAGMSLGIGFATDATHRACIAATSDDNVGTSAAGRYSNDLAVIIQSGSGSSLLSGADFVTNDSDGLTLNWTTASGSAYLVDYLSLGGDAAL